MLDVELHDISFGNILRDVTLTFPASRHTAIVGPPACGTSTLLRLIAGTLAPARGQIIFGSRDVTRVKAARRPLLYLTSESGLPGRWSVQHALVAAVRSRTLDREDRHHEYLLATEKWDLAPLLARRLDSLSSTEAARTHFARIELLRPAIVVADRILERVNGAARMTLADTLHRTLRVLGTTVIATPSARDELAFADHLVVLGAGGVLQSGSPAEIFAHPLSEEAALASGETDAIPIEIHGNTVESVIGSWVIPAAPFQGSGVALVRPSHFTLAPAGEDSDLIFGIEEAGFCEGRWIARGMLSGGVTLRVELPATANIHKGRLLPLRYDPSRFTLLPRESAPNQPAVPTGLVPPLSETR